MPTPDRILVVDDNVATRYAVRRVLEHHGFRVEEAGTGGDGLARLAEQDFGALVLDVNLPDMSGFDVVRQLREDARMRLLPVVHVSAASIATGDLITGLNAGADAYLIHPVDPDVLLATLRSLLRARRSEEALREAEARFGEIFRQINAPIAVIDASLQSQDANAAFVRLLGVDASRSGALEALLADQAAPLSALKVALAEGERWQGTFALRADAATRITEWRVTPYRASGQGVVLIEDITEHHARESEQRQELASAASELAFQIAERQRTEIELLQAQKMDSLGQLTGGIAHDFNNLLTTIISGLDMIEIAATSGKWDKASRYVEIATGSAHRAAALTQRMLAFARKQPLDPQTFDVVARIRSLEDMLLRSIGENIELELELGPQPMVAVADPNQFENVILNLVINARDALDGQGLIRIRAGRTHIERDHELAPGYYISVKVLDNGRGIPLELLTKVFEPFFTTKPQGEGTGLGLSMTYGFARQSGGSARIASEAGEGTEIELLLPEGELAATTQTAPPTQVPRGSAERILLVDDTDSVRVMVREMLVEAGYQVVEAINAQQALLELHSTREVDLLLSDVGLPGMNGRELADAARALRPHLPVLFVTGYTESAVVRHEFLGPGMSLLPKPFSVNELLRSVREMF
ncbi:response regulator [Stenotrophomonas sp. BIGb0135]|uniref:response regulator n=1 Tax=Stenotrophomonas sp. BIGb0135 TaxID=2940620 RepID=UPI00216761C6|nr:response regulator [Stenotrophomonas sp. BIGb0135]MCS4233388.1 DNA-binding response OmpR family regulator [Stenotrophomonas sp. BIGb0135]